MPSDPAAFLFFNRLAGCVTYSNAEGSELILGTGVAVAVALAALGSVNRRSVLGVAAVFTPCDRVEHCISQTPGVFVRRKTSGVTCTAARFAEQRRSCT